MAAETATLACPSAQTAILIVSFNGRDYLPDCLASIFASSDAPPPQQVIVVDNASTDGTFEWLCSAYPQIRKSQTTRNHGFAEGNNIGFLTIRQNYPHVKYVALLNQDTIVTEGWLRDMVKTAESDPAIASVQARLRLHPETTLLNSAGNESHYLGFGFVSGYRQEDGDRFDHPRDLAYCSGAAMLVRVSAVERELFDPTYFAYLEDAELGWYFRMRALRNVYCPSSIVHHRYQFRRNPQTYRLLEQNRWRLILSYYRVATLLLLLPIMLAMEGGLILYFLKVGALGQKLRSWSVLMDLPYIRRQRAQIQKQRKLSDRQFTAPFVAQARFPEVRNKLLTYIGNPLLAAYWRLVRLVMRW